MGRCPKLTARQKRWEFCAKGKFPNLYPGSMTKAKSVGHIHADKKSIIADPTVNGLGYFFVIVDEFSCLVQLIPIRCKKRFIRKIHILGQVVPAPEQTPSTLVLHRWRQRIRSNTTFFGNVWRWHRLLYVVHSTFKRTGGASRLHSNLQSSLPLAARKPSHAILVLRYRTRLLVQ